MANSAIVMTGGKQYRVQPGQVFCCEQLDAEPSKEITLDHVMMVTDGDQVMVGEPFLKGAKVKAEVVEQLRGPKIEIIKFKRRKHHMKRQGHRQYLTKLKVLSIEH